MAKRKYTDEELQGKKFYHLTLITPTRKPKGNTTTIYWLCKCDCGKLVERREQTIVTYRTQSCGCKHPRHNQGKNHPLWCGTGDISGQYFDSIKCRANKLKIEFDITIEQLWEIFLKQNRLCALTGLPLNFSTYRQRRKGNEQTASIDRIDSNKGYTIDNVQWVHKDINRMKNSYDQKYFLQICQLVVDYISPKIISNVPRITA